MDQEKTNNARELPFNEKQIAKLAVPIDGKPTEYRFKGVDGLSLIVGKGGTATYFVTYAKGKARRRYKLGRRGRGGITLADAVKRAERVRADVADGADPAADKASRREARLFSSLADIYEREHLPTLAPNTAESYRWIIRVHIRPALGDMLASEVTRSSVKTVVNGLAREGKRAMADRVARIVGSIFSFGIEEELVEGLEINPARGIKPKASTEGRKRNIKPEELRAVWAALDETGVSDAVARIVKIAWLTGCRRSEVALMRRSELSLDGDQPMWTIPGATMRKGKMQGDSRTKNKQPKAVPLAPWTLSLIRDALKDSDARQQYVFQAGAEGKNQTPHIDPHSCTRAVRRITVDLGILDLRLHDGRSAVRTWLREEGYGNDVRDAVLGHMGKSVGAKNYEAPTLAFVNKQVRPALQAWEAHVRQVVTDDKIVAFKKRA